MQNFFVKKILFLFVFFNKKFNINGILKKMTILCEGILTQNTFKIYNFLMKN